MLKDDAIENANLNKINNNKTITSKSFEYEKKITGRPADDNDTLNPEVVAP